ncbi:hypothetical protein BJ138DRAFT_1234730 [Hygrophoropsis aurantiaca]|uniref:Uncharacterized protein n=1 Tax=Hygrophoropsis aurantiaca TaxID=72124 RepID=A0ACB7ZUG2_9AGAM|nr:hypothetical protein BJ138DRAFT_1234730 [Hygrophoropsis aurantiaca]
MVGNNQSKKRESVLTKLRKRKAESSRRPSAFKKLRIPGDKYNKKMKAMGDGRSGLCLAVAFTDQRLPTAFVVLFSPPAVLAPKSTRSRKGVGRDVVVDRSDDVHASSSEYSSGDDFPIAACSKKPDFSFKSTSDDGSGSDEECGSDIEADERSVDKVSGSVVFVQDVPWDDGQSVSVELEVANDAPEMKVPVTPAHSVRKGLRTRKATEKVAALVKEKKPKAAPIPVEDPVPESNTETTLSSTFHQDIAATSLPPPESDFSAVDDRDAMLKSTYRDLVPLRSVALSGAGKPGGTIKLSNWPSFTKGEFNKQFVLSLVTFKSYAGYINMSRIDPALLTPKTISKGSYVSFLLGQGAQLAMCVSVIVVEDCFIGQPGTAAYGGPKKEITGYFLTQEFERFAGAAGAVFGEEHFATYSFNGAFKFGTYVDPKSSQSKPSPSSVTSPTTRAVLSHQSVVPLYDYRSERVFDPAIHLNPTMYGKLLPSHRDLPRHSLALVAYTTTRFNMRSGDIGLGANIMWAALLAAPGGASLPDPPSLLEQSPTKAAVARKKSSRKN